MWAETVDPSDLHNTVWPRAAAVAEVLWTPVDVIYPNGIDTGKAWSCSWYLLFYRYTLYYIYIFIIYYCILILPHHTVAPDLATAEDRLETFRCLLTRRGISAAPVTNTQARYQPKEPNSCFVQRRRI